MILKINGTSTDFFTCNVGVGQDENVSLFFFVFAFYIYDIEHFLQENNRF
jgi:hypothetical protein